MAIINNNVQNVQFLRNQTVNITREQAIDLLNTHKSEATDGSALLARYTDNGEVKTIVGYVYVSGDTHDITIIDVQGASGDVDELRDEINEKLGNGISSANTATAQLEALSGSTFVPGTSSSADTSVEGAKAYAYDLVGTLDGGITAETGSYVKSVSEVDGKISGTTAELPTVTGEVESKKVVMSVSEEKGEITVNKGTIESSDKTVVISDVETSEEVTGIDFKVNIDGVTLEKDENGVISVTSSALTQYVGDDDTIQISAAVGGVKTVSSPLTIEKVTTGLDADVREAYRLVGHSGNTIGDLVKIYKDSSLLSVALLHADTTADQQVLPTYNKETDTWTDIQTPTEANQALCFAYENVSGATVIAAVPVGSFINEQEFASGITWDSTANKVRGVVDPTSEGFLTVGADGFKLSGVQDAINAAVNGLDANISGNSTHVTVGVAEEDGVITAVTVSEDNIADADDLAELSGKTVTAITSTNGSITASIDDAAGCKTYDIETDASKIKMSGFTSNGALSGITTSSSITEAFGEVEDVIEENERVISESLNDLNSRINTVSGNVNTISGDVETIKTNYISGVSVNGHAVTVANKVAPISITAATSAATATSTEAIVVDTDANGEITIGLAGIDCGYYDGAQG